MKKKIWMIMLLAIMAVAITACGKSDSKTKADDNTSELEEENEKETYHFVIWGRKEDLSDGNWLKTRCDMFSAKYPDAEVTFDFAEYTPEEAAAKMKENRDEAPDIYIFTDSQITDLVESRLLTRMWGETEEYVLESNAQAISNMATYEEKVYGIPVSASPYVLYYDNTVFSAEDILSLDSILQKGKLSYPLTEADYAKAFGDVDEDFLKSLRKNDNFYNDENAEHGVEYLQNGTVNAMVGDADVYGQVQQILGERMGVVALPTFLYNGESRQMNCIKELQIVGVNPDCKHFEMTIALATYLGSADAQQMHYDMSRALPVNILVMDTLKGDPLAQIVGKMTTVEDLQRIQEALAAEEEEKNNKK